MPYRFSLTTLEADALLWALEGHNNAVEDSNYKADNPTQSRIEHYVDPVAWPGDDMADVLYRLEVQADDMSRTEPPDSMQFARTCKRVALKLRRIK